MRPFSHLVAFGTALVGVLISQCEYRAALRFVVLKNVIKFRVLDLRHRELYLMHCCRGPAKESINGCCILQAVQ